MRVEMNKKISIKKNPIKIGFAAAAIAFASLVVVAQDIVPVSDIGGGTSVFVFGGRSRSVAKKFVTAVRTRRTKGERIETSKRVTNQYAKLIKVAPRRTRTDAVRPDDPRMTKINTMPKEDASKLFAGVGEYYMDQDNYDQAIDVFRESLDLDKTNNVSKMGLSEALALKGNKLLAADSFPVARKFFEEALIYNDRNAPAYFGLAEVLTELDQGSAAAVNYEKALQFDKDLTEIYVPLGILYFQAGKPADILKAEDFLTKAIAIDANDAQSQFYLGLVRMNQGRDREALAAFTKAKTLDPKLAEAFYNSGEVNSKLNQNREAVVDFERAVALRPNYFEALFGLGSAYFELAEYQKAVDAYEKAKRLKNDNAEVVANLGDVYRQLGDFNKAESNYALAGLFFERQKDFATNMETREIAAETYSKVGFAVAKQCEKNIQLRLPCKWNAAVTALEKASTISNNPAHSSNLGWALHNAGKMDKQDGREQMGRDKIMRARDVLTRAVAANPAQVEGPLLNLGMVQTDLGEHKAAIETFKKVIQKEPKWVFALNELGIAYLNDGNAKEAVSQFKKAIGRDDKFAAAYFNLAKAEFKNGNLGEAKKAHAKLKSLGRADLAARLEVETGGVVRG
jgi:tetratricopeptide (TPR) repeat protein